MQTAVCWFHPSRQFWPSLHPKQPFRPRFNPKKDNKTDRASRHHLSRLVLEVMFIWHLKGVLSQHGSSALSDYNVVMTSSVLRITQRINLKLVWQNWTLWTWWVMSQTVCTAVRTRPPSSCWTKLVSQISETCNGNQGRNGNQAEHILIT